MGNGLYQLLTAARLSRTSDMPLWEELWQFWQDKYFTLDLSKYENLGLGGGGHMRAAGCTIEARDISEAQQIVAGALKEILE